MNYYKTELNKITTNSVYPARIKIEDIEFPNIIVAYLLDMMIHNDEKSGNTLFDELMDDFKKKGMFPILMRYFRNMEPNDRRKYKLIKNGVSPYDHTTDKAVIQVVPRNLEKAEEK